MWNCHRASRHVVVLSGMLGWLLTGTSVADHGRAFSAPSVAHDSVRGRVVVRNGVLRNTYRERWGNGVTANGALVLTSLFNNAALVGTGYFTGKPTSDNSSGGGKAGATGDFKSESAEQVTDEAHAKRVTTLESVDKRAEEILKKLGGEVDSPAPAPPAVGGDFSSESAEVKAGPKQAPEAALKK